MSELVRREYITCPNCKAVSLAAVTHDAWMPFDNYHHECNCGYLIGESEWDGAGCDRWRRGGLVGSACNS